jgi:ribosomal protein S18 acetylase RimI-like enzyme
MLRPANNADFGFLRAFSNEPSDEQLQAQIDQGRLRIIESEEGDVGFIKFCVLWEILPFIEVIIIRQDRRRCGLGTRAVRDWEREMAERCFRHTIVSTQANETAQIFWRRIGYQDCGSFTLPARPTELFLYRDISDTTA